MSHNPERDRQRRHPSQPAARREGWRNGHELDYRRAIIGQLTTAGHSAREIAQRLGVAQRTVVRHRRTLRTDRQVAA